MRVGTLAGLKRGFGASNAAAAVIFGLKIGALYTQLIELAACPYPPTGGGVDWTVEVEWTVEVTAERTVELERERTGRLSCQPGQVPSSLG